MLKQILFNFMIFFIEIIIFTNDFLSPEKKLSLALTGILIFWAGNLFFLYRADRQQLPENLHSVSEVHEALQRWLKKSSAFTFREELHTAIQQLETFHQKQRSLLAFDGSFRNISQETEIYLLFNMKKFLRRLFLCSTQEYSPLNRIALCAILEQNRKLLLEYDKLLEEVYQLNKPEIPCLESITQALKEVKNFS